MPVLLKFWISSVYMQNHKKSTFCTKKKLENKMFRTACDIHEQQRAYVVFVKTH